MENILRKIKKLVPRKIFSFFQPVYHYKLALLGAIKHLINGAMPPVHAVDSLITKTPQ